MTTDPSDLQVPDVVSGEELDSIFASSDKGAEKETDCDCDCVEEC